MLNEEQIRSLRKIENRTDKEHALYFVGRQDIITGIENTVAELQESIAGRTAAELFAADVPLSDQRTWLVQGAPGAGKTALQTHLRQIWGKRPDGPFAVHLEAVEVEDEAGLTRIIANAIQLDGAEKIGHRRRSEVDSGVTAQGGGINIRTRQERRAGELQLRDLWRLYDRGLWHRIRRSFTKLLKSEPSHLRPIVLLIDEIQNLPKAGESLLAKIHSGKHGLPMVAMLGGLAWSEARLTEAGISRFSRGHVRTLSPLTETEAADAVHCLLREHGIKGPEGADIAGKIARWSNGWPQHLQNYISALAGEVADRKGDLTQLDEVKIRTVGDLERKNYYNRRLTHSRITVCDNLLADVAEMIGPNGTSESKLLDLLEERAWVAGQKSSDKMPQDMKPRDFIDEMIRSGIIHRENRCIMIPIPSFRQYLIDGRMNG